MIFERLYSDELNLALNSADSNTLYTTARRKQAINDAQADFCDLTECLIRQSTVTVSCNTVEYALTSSAVLGSTAFSRLAAQGVEYRLVSSGASPTTITRLAGDADFPRKDIDWRNSETPGWRMSTTPTTPTGYYLRPDGASLYLGLDQPPLVRSSQTATLLVPFVARPAEMTSTGDVPFDSRPDLALYHRALPHGAAAKLLLLTGDAPRAEVQQQIFQSFVLRYLASQRPKGGTTVRLSKTYLRHKSVDGDGLIPPSQWYPA